MKYSSVVASLFDDLGHAGIASGLTTAIHEDRASGTRLMFSIAHSGREIHECRFLASGCPDVLAACEYTCRAIENQKWPTTVELMADLGVPTEKTSRILVIEDAQRELRDAILEK